MSVRYNGPNVHQLFEELCCIRDDFRDMFESGGDVGNEIDVRLQVIPGEGWTVLSGDPCYDTDHRGHWGAATVSATDSNNDLRAIGADLIEEVKNSIAAAEAGEW